jgi:hypothetical protein
MEFKTAIEKKSLPLDIDVVAAMIARTQRKSGEIPWSDHDKTDPWDLIEAVMGLNIGGYFEESLRAFDWMVKNQLEDGCWYASYINGVPEDKTRDTNMTSYIAVGVFHYYLITGDMAFLKKMWKTVEPAIDFALSLQAPSGEIHWALSPEGKLDPVALLTGSSSIYMSLKCALAIAKQLGYNKPEWKTSFLKLEDAIRNRPHLFNVTKSRFSMDWFYPILAGALTGDAAQKKIDKHWKKFVVEGLGVRCVSDEPWVTIAETSEFVLALSGIGNDRLARIVFNWIQDFCFDDGSYWCGFTFPNMVVWPEEKITWTNGVFLMAADALYNLTPASALFNHKFWATSEYSPFV